MVEIIICWTCLGVMLEEEPKTMGCAEYVCSKVDWTTLWNWRFFLATKTLWWRLGLSSILSNIGHINDLRITSILSKAKLCGEMLFFTQKFTEANLHRWLINLACAFSISGHNLKNWLCWFLEWTTFSAAKVDLGTSKYTNPE